MLHEKGCHYRNSAKGPAGHLFWQYKTERMHLKYMTGIWEMLDGAKSLIQAVIYLIIHLLIYQTFISS